MSKRRTNGTTPKKAPATKKRRVSLLAAGQERKFNTIDMDTDACTTESMNQLTTFAAGNTNLLRIGNKVQMKTIELKFSLQNSDTSVPNQMRLLVVVDKQPNAAAFALSALLDSNAMHSQRTLSGMSRFRVLLDEVIVANQNGGSTIDAFFFKRFIKIPKDLSICTWQDGTSAIPNSNSIAIAYFGLVACGATDLAVDATARLTFIG